MVWARLDAPWLAVLVEANAAGDLDPSRLVDDAECRDAQQEHLSRLIEAVSVLLPWVDETGPAWFAAALRERRNRYLDRYYAVSRGKRGAW